MASDTLYGASKFALGFMDSFLRAQEKNRKIERQEEIDKLEKKKILSELEFKQQQARLLRETHERQGKKFQQEEQLFPFQLQEAEAKAKKFNQEEQLFPFQLQEAEAKAIEAKRKSSLIDRLWQEEFGADMPALSTNAMGPSEDVAVTAEPVQQQTQTNQIETEEIAPGITLRRTQSPESRRRKTVLGDLLGVPGLKPGKLSRPVEAGNNIFFMDEQTSEIAVAIDRSKEVASTEFDKGNNRWINKDHEGNVIGFIPAGLVEHAFRPIDTSGEIGASFSAGGQMIPGTEREIPVKGEIIEQRNVDTGEIEKIIVNPNLTNEERQPVTLKSILGAKPRLESQATIALKGNGGKGKGKRTFPVPLHDVPVGAHQDLARIIQFLSAMNKLSDSRENNPAFFGPIMGRVSKKAVELPGIPEYPPLVAIAESHALMSTMFNLLAKQQSGVAINPEELERLRDQIPLVTDSASEFRGKVNVFLKFFEESFYANQEVLKRSRYDMSRFDGFLNLKDWFPTGDVRRKKSPEKSVENPPTYEELLNEFNEEVRPLTVPQ